MSKELHTEMYKAGGRVYFFDVRETSGGNRYLHITETKFKNGKKEEHEIVVFEEYVGGFAETLDSIRKYLQAN